MNAASRNYVLWAELLAALLFAVFALLFIARLALAGGFSIDPGTPNTSQGFVIDFPAFTAGVDQVSAQSMTGVAFGDVCGVGTATDQSAAIGQLSVMVTGANAIKVVASPVSSASTANPNSDTYTVKCVR